ncbi:MAG: FAD-binding protein, partial [Thermodesulfobacteriota bacterium]|nr:FAD-binding protein [Thermodesulfobacteriota bacterium]
MKLPVFIFESVFSIELVLPDGQVRHCSREHEKELFYATCGGMGLTGIILSACFKLQRVNSAYMQQKTLRARNLKEIFSLFEEYEEWPYSVAWIDCMAKGENQGRSLLMVGYHGNDGRLDPAPAGNYRVVFDFPGFCLNKYTVAAFNYIYYNRLRTNEKDETVLIDNFFYPLDTVLDWNRMYGQNGFVQYQFVLPIESSFEGLAKILGRISDSGMASFLAV